MKEERGSFGEWLVSALFVTTSGWLCWHASSFILDFNPSMKASRIDQISSMHIRKDVTPDLPGLFGGYADVIDWTCLIATPLLLIAGMLVVRRSRMEFRHWRPVDRFSKFMGRVSMLLVISMTTVMLTEVFLRYVFDQPTSWANETTKWMAMFVFLLSGIYAMQQRTHIRIVMLYDVLPRPLQRAADCFWIALLCLCVGVVCYFSYITIFEKKFVRWQVLDSAFNPPIPAIMMPVIWFVLILICIQAVLNLISDWRLTPEQLAGTDREIEEAEIEALKRAVEK